MEKNIEGLQRVQKKLDDGKSIYMPEVRDQIRELFREKDVLMIDLCGVLTAPVSGKEIVPDPAAIEAIQNLVKAGYDLVLWTQSLNENNRVGRFINDAGIKDSFDLVICGENFCNGGGYFENEEDKNNFALALETSTWLDEETVSNYRDFLEEDDIVVPKTPHFFMERCGVVDDSASYMFGLFSKDIQEGSRAKDITCPYPYFYVTDSMCRYGYDEDCLGEELYDFFGPWKVDEILEHFPVVYNTWQVNNK